MIEAPDLIEALHKRGIKWPALAVKIERTEQDVHDWLTGKSQIPPYIVLTLDAIKHRLLPADQSRMKFDDVATALGIEAQRVAFWRNTGQYPLAARYAMTAYDYQRETTRKRLDNPPDRLAHDQFKVLGLIVQAGQYWRVTGGWRARPQVGRTFPKLRAGTPDKLIAAGLATKQTIFRGTYVQATPEGRDRYYGKTGKGG